MKGPLHDHVKVVLLISIGNKTCVFEMKLVHPKSKISSLFTYYCQFEMELRPDESQ